MPNKEKISAEEKIRIVEEYFAGKIGSSQARTKAEIGRTTFGRWINRYRSEGPEGFQPNKRNRVYPSEIKERAVKDYLSGKGSMADICLQYRIKEDNQL